MDSSEKEIPSVSIASQTEKKEETVVLSADQKAIQDRLDKEKFAIERLKEMKNLWNYLSDIYGNRSRWSRKQFRRRFIKEDNFCTDLIDDCIKFYGANLQKNSKESIIFPKEGTFSSESVGKLTDLGK